MSEETTVLTEQSFAMARVISVAQDVLRRWYLILAVTLVAAMVSYMFTDATYKPQYTTSTTFVVTTGGTSSTVYQNLSATSSLAGVFEEVLNSSLLRSKVLQQVGISSFGGSIEASVISGTNLLTLRVTDSDPRIAFLVTRAIIEHHQIVSAQVLGSTILEVLQDPTVPSAPTNPLNLSATVRQISVLAAVAMCLLIGFLSFMSDKVRTQEEANAKLNCRVLGELNHEQKHKALAARLLRRKGSILITTATTGFLYTEAVGKLASRVERQMPKDGRVLMVTSLLENEGKSTVAVNLALSLSQKGHRVLLIDCDLRKPACCKILNLNWTGSGIVDVLQGHAEVPYSVRKSRHSDMHLLANQKSLRNAAELLQSGAVAAMLEQTGEYDYVIVDTPPMSLASDAEGLCEFCDASLLVVRQNAAGADSINEAIGILRGSRAKLLGCVLNNVYGSASFAPAFRSNYGYGRYGRNGYGKHSQYDYSKYSYGRFGKYGTSQKNNTGRSSTSKASSTTGGKRNNEQ